MSSQIVEYPAIWIAGANCSGCSISLLNTSSPTIRNLLIDPVFPGKHISLRFHATIMAGQGEPVLTVVKDTAAQEANGYLLLVEGAVPTAREGAFCTIGRLGRECLTVRDVVVELARDAQVVINVGTCASFGGIPAAAPNPTGARSVAELLEEEGISKPVINLPGCPPHPDWLTGTILSVLFKGLPSPDELDAASRPKVFYGKLIHDNCPRRADFDAGQFARHPSEPGCLYEIGCKGPVTYADCSARLWNNGVNWCVGSGSPCIGCVEPGFPDKLQPMSKKLDETALDRFRIRVRQ